MNISTFIFLFLISIGSLNAQSAKAPADTDKVRLSLVLDGCGQEMQLLEYQGIYFKTIQNHPPSSDTIVFEIPRSEPRFYYIGSTNPKQQKRPIILGNEDEVVITGNCRNLRSAKVLNSPLNTAYDDMLTKVRSYKSMTNKAARNFQSSGQNADKQATAMAEFKTADDRKLALLKELEQSQPYIRKVAALDTYVSFQTDPGSYKNELEHFVNTYFGKADLSDTDYNYIPYIVESFKNYTTTLASIGLPEEEVLKALQANLSKIPAGSMALRNALGGSIMALQQKNHPAFVEVASEYIKLFPEKNNPAFEQLKLQIKGAESFVTGAVAPDFGMKNPEGDSIHLSDLRGKVVLVDFWASWCGPCRKENPNVVRMYNAYKDKGFEILGVSLDKDRKRWMAAIEKDGLTWPHVSDLKGWQNGAAQMYGVRSIPHTILLDREGKIVARNLRGHTLERALKKLFKDNP